MKVAFNNLDTMQNVREYAISPHTVMLADENLKYDFGGFILYEDDGETVVRDCSDYKYQWNIHTEYPNRIIFTNSETYREPEPNPNAEVFEFVDPLTNEELTECVADLMYEISVAKLGV